MQNIVYIATSLDGYIARTNGELDWLLNVENTDETDYGYNEFINTIDIIIMGRVTFEKVLTLGDWSCTKPVMVLSKTIKKVLDHLTDKTEIWNGTIPQLIKKLNDIGEMNLYIDGGKTI